MANYKKILGIIFIIGLMLAVFISDAINTDSLVPERVIKFEEHLEEDIIPIAMIEVEPTTNASEEVISVLDYGARGDGVTDDTEAFQKAMEAASANNTKLVIPRSSMAYLILNSLELKSNIHISGYGAAIFMPSHSKGQNIFYGSSKEEISNVTIEGLTLLSENDQEGSGEYEGSLTSNIQGIYLFGVNNLTVTDVQMENMFVGIKLDASKNGDKSNNIRIDNLGIYSTRTPVFITSTTRFNMTNSVLDASGGTTKFLHSAYIRGGTNDIVFDRVRFINSPGGGVHIYNSNKDLSPPENIRIIDSHIENTKVGVYIFSGAKDIDVTNLIMKNIELPFKINNATRVNIEKVDISNAPDAIEPIGLFNMHRSSDFVIDQVTLDGNGMTGYLFDISSDVDGFLISDLMVTNLENVGLINGRNESTQNFVIEDSRVEWTSVKGPLIQLSGKGSYAIIRGNQFLNTGKEASRNTFYTNNANVIFENNEYLGFQ